MEVGDLIRNKRKLGNSPYEARQLCGVITRIEGIPPDDALYIRIRWQNGAIGALFSDEVEIINESR